MKPLRRWWKRLSTRPADDQLAAELEAHIAMQTDDNVRAGMSPAEARRAALLKFGSVEATKESYRDLRGFPILETLGRDLRQALRSFARRPVFAAAAVVSLALGLGSATTVFGVVDRALFRSPPYHDPDRLVSVGIVAPLIAPHDWLFAATYREARDAPHSPFEAMTSWTRTFDCDLAAASAVRVSCAEVESTFVPVLGIEMQAGRNFNREEDREGGPNVALLADRMWRSRYAGDPGIVGRQITIDGSSFAVVGVLPPTFELPSLASADILLPQRLRATGQRQRVIRAIGRLRPGVSPAMAEAQLTGPFKAFVDSAPDDFRKTVQMRLRVETLKDQQTKEVRLAYWILLGAVICVLLIACTNVSNLLLTEAASRRRELAIRAVLGATRWRLFAQRVTESVLLAVFGGVGGLAMAAGLLRIVVAASPEGMLRLKEATVDARVFLFAAAASLCSGILVALAAAFESPKQEALTGARVAGSRTDRIQRCFIAAQVAASVVLLSAAGLLIASLRNMQDSPLGFQPENVARASFTLNAQRYGSNERQIAFAKELEERLRQLPGTSAVALSDSIPPGGDPRSVPFVAMLGGGDRAAAGMDGNVLWRYVTPGYFRAMGIPIVRGRDFGEEDALSNEQVMIVNQTLSARLFPGVNNPVMRLAWNSVGRSVVVGVAADVRNGGIGQATQSEFYVVRRHEPGGVYGNQRPPYGWRRATAVVRTSLPQRTIADLLRSEFARLDPALPVELGTMEHHIDNLLQRPRFTGWVLSLLAGTGLLLAAVGLYGVISYNVAERTRDIGIRIALGAAPASIVRMTLQSAMSWVSGGALVGILGAIPAGRFLRGLLFGVPERDPRILASALAVLAVVAIAASIVPARRATRIDPAIALRQD